MSVPGLVAFVERALMLKGVPVLSDASPDQLAAFAERVSDRAFIPGARLFCAGTILAEIHLLCEGEAHLERSSGAVTGRCSPGEFLGLLAGLEQRPCVESCVADTAVRIATLRVHDLFDLLEDSGDLTRSLLSHLASRLLASDRDGTALDGVGDALVGVCQPIDLLDRISFMKGVRLLRAASIDELARLAAEVDEVAYAPGEEVCREQARADAFFLVLCGRIAEHGPRTCVGVVDVLCQAGYAATRLATEPTRALRVRAEPFFDLLEDHVDMTARVAADLSAACRTLEHERPDDQRLPGNVSSSWR